MSRGQNRPAGDVALTVATYVALLLFGVGQSLLGTFFYGSGPAPLAAIGFDVAIFASCFLGAWGLRTPAGALAPAIGWLVPTFFLASGTSGGSVLIQASAAGEWFLFGGAISATAGVVASFILWPRSGGRRGWPVPGQQAREQPARQQSARQQSARDQPARDRRLPG